MHKSSQRNKSGWNGTFPEKPIWRTQSGGLESQKPHPPFTAVEEGHSNIARKERRNLVPEVVRSLVW